MSTVYSEWDLMVCFNHLLALITYLLCLNTSTLNPIVGRTVRALVCKAKN